MNKDEEVVEKDGLDEAERLLQSAKADPASAVSHLKRLSDIIDQSQSWEARSKALRTVGLIATSNANAAASVVSLLCRELSGPEVKDAEEANTLFALAKISKHGQRKKVVPHLNDISSKLESDHLRSRNNAAWTLNYVANDFPGAVVPYWKELSKASARASENIRTSEEASSLHYKQRRGCVSALERVSRANSDLIRAGASLSHDVSSGDKRYDLQNFLEKVPAEVRSTPSLSVPSFSVGDLERINGGGQARIDLLPHPKTDSGHIAIKRPLGGKTISRDDPLLESEISNWQSVDDHEHIIKVYEHGWVGGSPYIAMEYAAKSLKTFMNEDDVTVTNGLWFGVCLADALWHAHRNGIVHLDVKPHNVLIQESSSGEWDVPKLADWGVSQKLLEITTTKDTLSPRYAAPEEIHDTSPLDHRTDIYQLGVTLYELLTGVFPYDTPPKGLTSSKLNQDYSPVSELVPELPAQVDQVFNSLLSPHRDERYETAVDVRRQLSALAVMLSERS